MRETAGEKERWQEDTVKNETNLDRLDVCRGRMGGREGREKETHNQVGMGQKDTAAEKWKEGKRKEGKGRCLCCPSSFVTSFPVGS